MGTQSGRQDFWALVRNIPVCMLTTRDVEVLRSRPMATAIDEENEEFLFLTRASSHKSRELEERTAVNLSFAVPERDLFISVSGDGRVTEDHETARQLWNPYAAAYFPEGPEGQDVAVLRVAPRQAEYWVGGRPQQVEFAEIQQAIETGTQPDLGTNEKVQF